MFDMRDLILTSILFAECLMISLWLISLKLRFLSAVDLFWSLGLGALVAWHFRNLQSFSTLVSIALGLFFFWNIRLSAHLFLRLKELYPKEDSRYETLKASWNRGYALNTFAYFQFQALTIAALPLPFALLRHNIPHDLTFVFCMGIFLSILGIAGESLADWQLSAFKKLNSTKNVICRTGLWKYSRHPNYFFEWITWCGFGFMGFSSGYGALSLLSPLVMFVLLNFVSGIGPSEKQSIKRHGEEYLDYKTSTSSFFLWPPKKINRKDISHVG